jgi:ElaB/YqjD/DUF883 family membrane-anchored ribosome-binding protein
MNANGSADKLINDLHAVIRDAETLLRATAAQTGDKIQEARARAEESVRLAKERLAGVEDEALERARGRCGRVRAGQSVGGRRNRGRRGARARPSARAPLKRFAPDLST